MKVLRKIYLALIFVFLYSPILVLVVFSFNTVENRSQMKGFTLRWYAELFQDETLLVSLRNTLIIAVIASVCATVIGTYAAFLINKMKPIQKKATMSILNIPNINAEIVTGLSLMLLFVFASIELGFATVLIAHIAFNVPYVVLSVMPRVRKINYSTYEAALDLGASKSLAFRKVILPDIMPGILSGFFIAFTMSLDDFIITYFTTGPGFPTLSVTINTMTKKTVPLTVNALSTLMFLVVFVILLIVTLAGSKEEGEGQ